MGRHPGHASSPVLDIRDLSVEYVGAFTRTRAVRGLSLTVREGEVYGLVGESGCGKSTVALACMGYLPPKTHLEGQVLLQGQDVLALEQRQLRELRGKALAMVYQDPLSALNPSLTVGKQITEVLTTHEHVSARAAQAHCIEMLSRVRIADPELVMGRYPHQLSGGMQQRVLIAMALLLKPRLLIMDEPTTGLDVTVEAAVLDLVDDLRRETNTAVLLISHNLGVVARLCQRVGVMYAGEMVEEADIEQLFKHPLHPYTMGLLRCVPRISESKTDYTLWSIPGRVPSLRLLPQGCTFAPRCPLASDRCVQEAIGLREIDGRRVRCLLACSSDFEMWSETCHEDAAEGVPDRVVGPSGGELAVEDLRVYFAARPQSRRLWAERRAVRAVDGVSFRISPASSLAIVGESGCGKSTIARAVAGLVPLTSGRIVLDSADLSVPVGKRSTDTLRRLQMVFQNPDSTLNPQKTIREELRRPLRLFRLVSREREDEAILRLLEEVNLDDSYLLRYPGELSGGEKQRVAIARAFAGCPELVLCDEPTSSLDVSVQSTVLNMILRLQVQHGVSLLFISHDLGVVRYLADEVAILYLGQICEQGRTERVFSPPHHPYVEALLSAIPIPDPTVKRRRILLEGSVPSATDPPSGCRFHTRCPRKVGPICEEREPPCRERDGLVVFCHIPLDELERCQAGAQCAGTSSIRGEEPI